MSRINPIKSFIPLLVLIAVACSISSTPAVVVPPTRTAVQQAPIPTRTEARQAPLPTATIPQNSICGWIENSSSTGVMAPKMTLSDTGQVLQLWNLQSDAIAKFNYISPAYFRVYDPVYQDADLLVNFSSIEQVSSCPISSTITTNPSTAPQNSICGWIENSSGTGAMAPKMTLSDTGQVLQLWNLQSEAIAKFNYVSPAYFRVYDPVYQDPDLLVNFSSIEQVSSCPIPPAMALGPTQAAYVSGFAGTWDTNWGDMTCRVEGRVVNCDYSHDSGKIEATLSPDGITMEGSWSESPSYQPPDDGGKVTFTLSADGNSISGHWWYGQIGDAGSWTGNRK